MLTIDTTLSPQTLVNQVLMDQSSDLIIKNVRYSGKPYSIAAFENDLPEELIDAGIILSSGNVFDALGPNDAVNTGSRSSARTDNDLQAIATSVVTDAAVLEFDLIALRDSLEFTFIFASEEYPEYVNKGVNDVFGFFIKEEGSRALHPRNIALLPDGRTTVSIDNVNHRRNEEYFLPSDFLHVHSDDFWREHPQMALRAKLFQFDGFTVPLKAKLKLREGKTYHLKIAIADVGDRIYDSAVLIKAKSLSAKGKRIPQADKIVKEYVGEQLSKLESKYLSMGQDSLTFDLRIQFNTNESEILPDSYSPLHDLASMMQNMKSLKLLIIGHTDNVGAAEENMILSIERAKAVRSFLVQQNISTERLSMAAKGETAPLNQNNTEAERFENRRVEFHLSF
ncbi:MAG: OmpA family protein [Vicingaceae bacterium]